jgi:HEPN domain-containing protein
LRKKEKYLKAFIIAHQLEFKPIHNLLELLEICSQKESKIKEIEKACRYLNPFYVDTRYPVHWPTQYNKDSSLKAEQAAREIREWIRKTLKF